MPTLLAVVAVAAALGAGSARARIDVAQESGLIRLDSATAVARGASSTHWRDASPLDVPDRFGPGSILSVGNVRMKVINNGTLGNPYTNLSTDPSAQWPGYSGVEYLNAITFAVGAVNPFTSDPDKVRRVSYFEEWRPPTLDPVDRIYTAYEGIPNGARFVNDDGDVDRTTPDTLQKIDEDFLDGHDNDLDGLIDEDYGALGQQEFSYVIRDDTPEATHSYFKEQHVPIGLRANVRAWAYSGSGMQDLNVCEYDVTNVSGHMLDSLTIGWQVDMDTGPTETQYWADDVTFPGYPSGEFTYRVGNQPGDLPDPPRKQGGPDRDPYGNLLQTHIFAYYLDGREGPIPADSALCPRVNLRVNAFSVGDQDGDQGRTTGMGTFMLIDETTDITGNNAPRRVGFRSFRTSLALPTFQQGGMPRDDQERFQLMISKEGIDPATGFIDAPPRTVPGDYVAMCSVGPWRNVQPGQTITATIAFGVSPGTAQLASGYTGDYQRYLRGDITGSDLVDKYPALANALAAQIAFEGIHEFRLGYLETRPIRQGGRDNHGRETAIKLPLGTPHQTIREVCGNVERVVTVTDHDYSWFNFDCDYCTGVWADSIQGFPRQRGLFHHTWYVSAPPPNPNTNVSSRYDFTDNPDRRIVPAEDRAVHLAWDNLSEVTPDPNTGWLDFRGFDIWKSAGWLRPIGSAGPRESDWSLLGEFRVFDYFTADLPGAMPFEHNYSRDATTGDKICPRVFIPGTFDPVTRLYGKLTPICLDRFDLWNWHTGEVVAPDWTTPCEFDTSGPVVPIEIDSGDLEWNSPALGGGSYVHVFRKPGSYPYLCLRHAAQKGTVVVADGGADSATVQVLDAAAGFAPASVTIRPGGHVRWVNRGAANHALQTDRHCMSTLGLIVHRADTRDLRNYDTRLHYPIGRYQVIDREVHNGFTYLYSITAFDSTLGGSRMTELGGRRSAYEAEAVAPQASVDANGKQGVWVVPNPYRGYASIQDRPSAWDLTPSVSDPTGTHIDFMGLPGGKWTIRIYTVAGDLVQELHSSDAVNESIRRPVRIGDVTVPGYNRQQDTPNDGEARWNLISRNGQDIASGIYLFTVDSSEGSQRGKFVIIR